MKKYSLKDNEHDTITHYSRLQWNIAWILVYLGGMLTSSIIF